MKIKRLQKGMSKHKTRLVQHRLATKGIKSKLQSYKK